MREDADESDEEELMLARAISASLETAKAASAPGIEKETLQPLAYNWFQYCLILYYTELLPLEWGLIQGNWLYHHYTTTIITITTVAAAAAITTFTTTTATITKS
jgi:hypothetical protein